MHVAMSGQTFSFSDADVVMTAKTYCHVPAAPVVKGHPANDLPRLGEVLSVHARDGVLFAEADISSGLEREVSAGAFKYVSASFFGPDMANNPCPGAWTLKHVGCLGAIPPAVKGLGALSFAEPLGASVTVVDACGVSFGEGAVLPRLWSRDDLHQAAQAVTRLHPQFSYVDAVCMFERHA